MMTELQALKIAFAVVQNPENHCDTTNKHQMAMLGSALIKLEELIEVLEVVKAGDPMPELVALREARLLAHQAAGYTSHEDLPVVTHWLNVRDTLNGLIKTVTEAEEDNDKLLDMAEATLAKHGKYVTFIVSDTDILHYFKDIHQKELTPYELHEVGLWVCSEGRPQFGMADAEDAMDRWHKEYCT